MCSASLTSNGTSDLAINAGSGKAINLMEALRKSVQGDKAAPGKKIPQKAAAAREGIALVKASKGGKRKSA